MSRDSKSSRALKTQHLGSIRCPQGGKFYSFNSTIRNLANTFHIGYNDGYPQDGLTMSYADFHMHTSVSETKLTTECAKKGHKLKITLMKIISKNLQLHRINTELT